MRATDRAVCLLSSVTWTRWLAVLADELSFSGRNVGDSVIPGWTAGKVSSAHYLADEGSLGHRPLTGARPDVTCIVVYALASDKYLYFIAVFWFSHTVQCL